MFDAHPPFQTDGNFGVTAGIIEVLVQSHEREVKLLPSLPKAWKSGLVKGIVARGGYIIDMKWKDGIVIEKNIWSSQYEIGGINNWPYEIVK